MPYTLASLPWDIPQLLPQPLDGVVGQLGQVVPSVDDETEGWRGDADDVKYPKTRL